MVEKKVEPDLPKIKPVRRQIKESRRPMLAAAAVLVMVGLGVLAVKTDAPKQWYNLIYTKFHKAQRPHAPAPAAAGPAPPAPVPIVEKKAEPVKPAKMHALTMTKRRTAVMKKAPQIVQKPASPAKEKKLATQKFYLPGVPSPKLAASKIDRSAPLPEAKEAAIGPSDGQEEKVQLGKSAKGAKDSGNADWKKQASWGD